MNITVIGAGYVGLVTAACFAEMGNTVACVENDPRKLEALRQGRPQIYEPGLDALITSNVRESRLRFTADLREAAAGSRVHFIAVGTPPDENGAADVSHVLAVAQELGAVIEDDCLVVGKSTVPVGTAERIGATIDKAIERRGLRLRVEIVSNPEFLKEGTAISDFMRPDRVIVGTDSAQAAEVMRLLYAPFTRNHERMILMGVRDAEMTKYAANAMLATRISFMNEIADLCERLGVDVENVRRGIGSDSRIGHAFIYAGCGYGGSCFPKDVRALVHMAEGEGVTPGILRAVEERNGAQKERLFEKMRERFGAALSGSTIAVWGLAFKPGTDDMREAPSLALIARLMEAGARVRAYDPAAADNARLCMPETWIASGRMAFATHQYDAVAGADALALVTEWKPFRLPDFGAMRRAMRQHVIFDGRNQYDPQQVRAEGFEYFGFGRPVASR